ncbi:MAG TPA: ferredoxin [Bdellovibrionales bacterium]|nr:ferredoxin [Bdellovibrionales bacterium]HCM39225.1 ferredoxin [Bdellovibrionales bacterium]
MSHPKSITMDECIENCFECHQICLETMQYGMDKGGEHSEPSHLRILQNCASICETSAQFMISGSPLHPKSCELCAEACSSCAESCEKMEGDQQMVFCAETCRKCAESCEEMSSGAHAGAAA